MTINPLQGSGRQLKILGGESETSQKPMCVCRFCKGGAWVANPVTYMRDDYKGNQMGKIDLDLIRKCAILCIHCKADHCSVQVHKC